MYMRTHFCTCVGLQVDISNLEYLFCLLFAFWVRVSGCYTAFRAGGGFVMSAGIYVKVSFEGVVDTDTRVGMDGPWQSV